MIRNPCHEVDAVEDIDDMEHRFTITKKLIHSPGLSKSLLKLHDDLKLILSFTQGISRKPQMIKKRTASFFEMIRELVCHGIGKYFAFHFILRYKELTYVCVQQNHSAMRLQKAYLLVDDEMEFYVPRLSEVIYQVNQNNAIE